MNKKLIRGIVISGLLLIILATAILNINIEPANKVVDEPKESLNLSEKINIDKEKCLTCCLDCKYYFNK